jgi:hypothetical protein
MNWVLIVFILSGLGSTNQARFIDIKFTSQEKCELAGKEIQKNFDLSQKYWMDLRWICVEGGA